MITMNVITEAAVLMICIVFTMEGFTPSRISTEVMTLTATKSSYR